MKRLIPHLTLIVMLALLAVVPAFPAPSISGDYLEARTSDVYTGPCFANSEVNTAGGEAVFAWRVRQGAWKGTALDGLSVVAGGGGPAAPGGPPPSPPPAPP